MAPKKIDFIAFSLNVKISRPIAESLHTSTILLLKCVPTWIQNKDIQLNCRILTKVQVHFYVPTCSKRYCSIMSILITFSSCFIWYSLLIWIKSKSEQKNRIVYCGSNTNSTATFIELLIINLDQCDQIGRFFVLCATIQSNIYFPQTAHIVRQIL